MAEIEGLESDVHFGEIGQPLPDWREFDFVDIDPDDEELEETPADVVAVLGFDPLELEDEEVEGEKHLQGRHNQLTHGRGGGGGSSFGAFNTVRSKKERFPPVSNDPAPGKDYEYHATTAKNLPAIAENGLEASRNSWISVAPHLEAAHFWGSMVGNERSAPDQPVMLRMKRSNVKHGSVDDDGMLSYDKTPELDKDSTREHVITRSVPSTNIEMYLDGTWINLGRLSK